jgi:hypothetical protein
LFTTVGGILKLGEIVLLGIFVLAGLAGIVDYEN